MNENYLIHHGILGQKWGERNGPPYPLRYGQFSTGEKRAGAKEGKSISNAVNIYTKPKKTKNEGNVEISNALNDLETLNLGDISNAITDLMNKGYSISDIVKNLGINIRIDRDLSRYGKNKDSNSEDKKEEIDKNKVIGALAVQNMSDEELKKKIKEMNDKELGASRNRVEQENKLIAAVKTSDTLKKEKEKEELKNRQADLNDAKNLANQTAELARNMKNLKSNSSNAASKTYINPKEIRSLTNEELISLTERAKLENAYLSATNQTVQKGKKAINWDKIAQIAGIAGTGIAIYSTLVSIKSRDNKDSK